MMINKYIILGEGDSHDKIVVDSLDKDSLSTDESRTSTPISRDWMEKLLVLGIAWGRGGGSSSPGDSSAWHIQGVGCYIMKVYRFLNNLLSGSEHGCISYLLCLSDQFFAFINLHFDWMIIPIPVVYILYDFLYDYYSYLSNVCKIDLQFRVPSYRTYLSIFNSRKQNLCIKTFLNFLQPVKGTLFLGDLKAAGGIYTNYTKYHFISTYPRLHLLKDLFGLVCVNRLNLVLDTVHNTYAGVGLKCFYGHLYSSILVQTITKAYSRVHRLEVYGLFNILVITGIGVVVWYKYVIHNGHPPHIPESIDCFKNPTAVVEGYKRVTFWMTQDIHEIVKHTFKYEPSFNDVDLPETHILDRDIPASIGTAIMLATFITTNVLIPFTLSTNVEITQQMPGCCCICQ